MSRRLRRRTVAARKPQNSFPRSDDKNQPSAKAANRPRKVRRGGGAFTRRRFAVLSNFSVLRKVGNFCKNFCFLVQRFLCCKFQFFLLFSVCPCLLSRWLTSKVIIIITTITFCSIFSFLTKPYFYIIVYFVYFSVQKLQFFFEDSTYLETNFCS